TFGSALGRGDREEPHRTRLSAAYAEQRGLAGGHHSDEGVDAVLLARHLGVEAGMDPVEPRRFEEPWRAHLRQAAGDAHRPSRADEVEGLSLGRAIVRVHVA